eukprot:10838438-Alexandrium_andersonii.AAC.1
METPAREGPPALVAPAPAASEATPAASDPSVEAGAPGAVRSDGFKRSWRGIGVAKRPRVDWPKETLKH